MVKPIMKYIFKFISFLLIVGVNTSIAQTNPTPWNLNFAGVYTFNNWPAASVAGTYPASAIWHRTSTLHPPKLAATTGDYVGAYNNVPANFARIDGQGVNGFDFVNDITNNDHNLGAFVVGLNTVGRTAIIVNWSGRGVSIGSLYNVILQYRLSTVSAWTDISPISEFVGTGGITATTPFTVNISTATGGAVDNRPNVQVRWKYYYVSGVASLSKIRISAISITSSALAGKNTGTDLINGSPFCVTPTIGAAVSVPFKYEDRTLYAGTTFTAQLSDNLGFFTTPVNIGSVVSNGTGTQIIAATIPPGTIYGTAYRIRVISNVAGFATATDNLIDLTVKLSPTDIIAPSSVCITDSATVSWTLPTISCFTEVLVVANANSAVVGTPSGNGSAYTANSIMGSGTVFGTGFVVYKGASTNVIVSNLTPGTPYYYKIWVRYGSEWSTGQTVNCTPDYQTKVLINGYLNANLPINEWTELIVTGDNLDMRNYKIRDNNSTQTGWQSEQIFNNIPFWQHIRKGTVIMLYHRPNFHTLDIDPTDGYLQLDLFDAAYFNGGDVSNTMNLAGPGDIVEILTPTFGHIHGVGHKTPQGAQWTLMPTPKLNYEGGTVDGDAIYVCPGANIEDFDGPSSTTKTAKSSVSITFGLPNACAGSTNETFWKSLRQPYFTPQTSVFSSIVSGAPGSVTFSWLPATDTYPADNITGYIILRNTSNSFLAPPSDGTSYLLGATIGGATVVANIAGSGTTTFTDNTVMNGNTYYYRVYAYRFNDDNFNGNSYNVARGRAYNENDFVSVNWPGTNPLPVTLLNFNGFPDHDKIHLMWSTSSEKNNDYFIIDKSTNGNDFTFLGKVKGFGTTTSIHDYSLDDLNPINDINYYSLTQVDLDGKQTKKKVIAVRLKATNTFSILTYPNPFSESLQLECLSNGSNPIELRIYDCLGKVVFQESKVLNEGANHFQFPTSELASGTYFMELSNKIGESYHTRIIKK